MPLRLKTKLTLSTALLVLAVAVLISCFYIVRLVRQVVDQARERANIVAQMVFFHAQHALNDAADSGLAPASSDAAAVQDYVRQALDQSAGLTSIIDASVGNTPSIYEVTIADRSGTVLISSDASLPGRISPQRPSLREFAESGSWRQLRALYGPPGVFELDLPFNLGAEPFGEIRILLSTALLRREIDPVLQTAAWAVLLVVAFSTLAAAVLSHASLRPLARISAQLDSISKGEAAPAAVGTHDELGQVSTKISQIGQQLRGVQEIFSDLRENVNHVMAGLDDGLILFTQEGRAALVSPAVEKFLGVPVAALTGKTVTEIFPPGHALRAALRMDGDRLAHAEPVEVLLPGDAKAPSRAVASVQLIHATEGSESLGALLTLRDVESIEKIGSQLQVSERLAALGKVTAGVAHEVKNPLNSMRLWLENLKQSIPAGGGEEAPPIARQAVQILDSEIDRLDRVVKTFLDFSRPVEVDLQRMDVYDVLRDVAAVAAPQFSKAGVHLTVRPDSADYPVLADRQLLKQALLNLTLNALEALQRSSGRAEAGRVTLGCAQNGNQVRILVQDNGPGIAPEHRSRIFQLYFTTRPGGSGIGLATAFRIAQMHNGSMDFESEVGRGTTFQVELPLAVST
jgi:PAS domain S-box-containing protein